MIDLKQLNQHPANRLASHYLEIWGEPANPHLMPLLQLTVTWLERSNPTNFPYPRDWEELKEQAYHLETSPPGWVASLLVENPEELENDLEAKPEPGREWQVLSQHLDQLKRKMQQLTNPEKVGRMLAENLYIGLGQTYPDFGSLNNSTLELRAR
jgi:hypothetical protein